LASARPIVPVHFLTFVPGGSGHSNPVAPAGRPSVAASRLPSATRASAAAAQPTPLADTLDRLAAAPSGRIRRSLAVSTSPCRRRVWQVYALADSGVPLDSGVHRSIALLRRPDAFGLVLLLHRPLFGVVQGEIVQGIF